MTHPKETPTVSDLKLTLTSDPRIPTSHGEFTGLAAFTNFGTAAHTLAAGFGIAGLALKAAARQAEESANALRIYMAEQLEPHAFTPDHDLACTHPQCTFTAEQH